MHRNTLQHHISRTHTATHCNTLQHMQHTATHCNTLQHTATHCNTLQHTATRQGLISRATPRLNDKQQMERVRWGCVSAYTTIKRNEIAFDRCVASVFQCVAVLTCVAVCCSVLHCVAVCKPILSSSVMNSRLIGVLQVCGIVLQCVQVWCSVLH